jgi:cytosine/adenosine deaminase-related metal-dependent hydrolase
MSLVDWIRLIIAERTGRKPSPHSSLDAGVQESHRFGVTTIADISTGIEIPSGDVIQFHEVIGFSRARAESAAQALRQRLLNPKTYPTLPQGISPHAPYTVSPELLRTLIRDANVYDFPMAMHLAESREELQLLRDGSGPFKDLLDERSMWDAGAIPPASRPLDYLRTLADAPRTLVIHGNYLDEEELAYLAAHRDHMSLVYCPRTHSYFFHPQYPLGPALAAGVRVALGTDSRASNPNLSLLAEMRHVLHLHPHLDPYQVLRMGTINGAEALGYDRLVGSIDKHKRANLVALPIKDEAPKKPDEILASILAADSAPTAVYLAGRRL